ncbi:hypothetical protein [Pseudomonas sp. Q1]|uniref:hypothetical protein n=1 Tax=Pseudomonas sp. Q1 TaxID=2202823 RepID=UPI0013750BE2|nr:hypothetical protein [Pseudomonas sp. Q1]NCE83135.1 hypothetical protein [Pseudomonas sp. Q1]
MTTKVSDATRKASVITGEISNQEFIRSARIGEHILTKNNLLRIVDKIYTKKSDGNVTVDIWTI